MPSISRPLRKALAPEGLTQLRTAPAAGALTPHPRPSRAPGAPRRPQEQALWSQLLTDALRKDGPDGRRRMQDWSRKGQLNFNLPKCLFLTVTLFPVVRGVQQDAPPACRDPPSQDP